MESEPSQKRTTGKKVLDLALVVVGAVCFYFFATKIFKSGHWTLFISFLVVAAILLQIFIHSKEGKSSIHSIGISLLAIIFGSIPALFFYRYQQNPPLDQIQRHTYNVLLIGESRLTQWDTFVHGFRLALANDIGEQLPEDGRLIGKFDVGNENIDINIMEVKLPENSGSDEQDEKAVKTMISNLVTNKDNVMLVGFVTSTRADWALQAIEETTNFAWPTIILPMATASSLVRDHNPNKDRPILRIVPRNSIQAESMADEIANENTNQSNITVAIFRDSSNPKYSLDLAEELRKRIESKNAAVIFDGSIGPDGQGEYISDSFSMLRPDYIVFVGMLETGVPLIRQVQAMKKQINAESKTGLWDPIILLSDGSVDLGIASYAQKQELMGVRGFFPHGVPTAYAQQFSSDPNASFKSPSFTMFGYDAAIFAHQILATAASENTNVNRASLIKATQEVRAIWNAGDAHEHVLVGNYRFDDYGDVTDDETSGLRYLEWYFDGSEWICGTDENGQAVVSP